VSFDLAVWDGERPETDQAALDVYRLLIEQWHGDGMVERLEAKMRGEKTDHDPTPAIARYVASLLDRWPDITTDEGVDSPWSDGPLINNATGPFFYFGMVWSMAEEASGFAARVAEEQGLVCFDPQAEALR